MAVDIYSARLGMLEMGTGNQNNSWGTSFNGSVTDVIDRAIAGIITRANTGGTLDLSTNPPPAAMRQDIDAIQNFTGALTAHQTVIVPNLSKTWLIANNTSGAFNLYIKTTAGNPTQIPQGTTKFVYCNGSDVVKRLDDEEIGSFRISGKAAAGAGELACNGASLLRADFPDLFGKISTTWGAVDGTHFTLPLLTDTNRFLRAAGGSLTVGTYQANQNLAHTHAGSTFSGTTTGQSNDHTHTGSGSTGTESNFHNHNYDHPTSTGTQAQVVSGASAFFWTGGPAATATSSNNQLHTHPFSFTSSGVSGDHTHNYSGTVSVTSSGGTEARPESAAVLICIKY